MKANYHTHTTRCKHSIGTEKEYVESAIEMGLKVLGFSGTYAYLFPDGNYSSDIRMDLEFLDEMLL